MSFNYLMRFKHAVTAQEAEILVVRLRREDELFAWTFAQLRSLQLSIEHNAKITCTDCAPYLQGPDVEIIPGKVLVFSLIQTLEQVEAYVRKYGVFDFDRAALLPNEIAAFEAQEVDLASVGLPVRVDFSNA